ncbi:hypothetical protein DENSPDRAFT_877994 [Dentipellis sp. KUC8613]|nr:hypothetical protein DENSPDRAFT_877994 [Dentipellis sp. KUC8613]
MPHAAVFCPMPPFSALPHRPRPKPPSARPKPPSAHPAGPSATRPTLCRPTLPSSGPAGPSATRSTVFRPAPQRTRRHYCMQQRTPTGRHVCALAAPRALATTQQACLGMNSATDGLCCALVLLLCPVRPSNSAGGALSLSHPPLPAISCSTGPSNGAGGMLTRRPPLAISPPARCVAAPCALATAQAARPVAAPHAVSPPACRVAALRRCIALHAYAPPSPPSRCLRHLHAAPYAVAAPLPPLFCARRRCLCPPPRCLRPAAPI